MVHVNGVFLANCIQSPANIGQATDVIGEAAFGESFHTLETGEVTFPSRLLFAC